MSSSLKRENGVSKSIGGDLGGHGAGSFVAVPCAGYTAVCEHFCGVFSTEIFKTERECVRVSHTEAGRESRDTNALTEQVQKAG